MSLDDRHVVSIYRPTTVTSPGYREKQRAWSSEPVAKDVRCDLQPGPGDVSQEQYGRQPSERRVGFFPWGTDIRPDDGVVVTSGDGPPRYLVKGVRQWGPRWRIRAELEETTEAFP